MPRTVLIFIIHNQINHINLCSIGPAKTRNTEVKSHIKFLNSIKSSILQYSNP